MNDYFIRVSKQTATRFWINNVTGDEADKALAAGAIGCTQNPSYTWKILNSPDPAARENANQALEAIIKENPDSSDTEILTFLQRRLVGEIAEHFMPLYESTKGQQGYVSIQGDPTDESTENILRWARYNREVSPNIMCKIPVTEEGLKAIHILAKERVPINATECMAVKQVLDVCDTYVEAIKGMSEPAPLCFSLITGIFDEYLKGYVQDHSIDICPDVLWQAGISVAKKVHEIVNQRKYPVIFIGGGARGLHHFTEMVGADASITINWVGTADKLIEMNQPVVSRFLQPTPHEVIDELYEKLPDYRKAYFINSIKAEEYEEYGPVVLFRDSFVAAWENALEYIHEKRIMK